MVQGQLKQFQVSMCKYKSALKQYYDSSNRIVIEPMKSFQIRSHQLKPNQIKGAYSFKDVGEWFEDYVSDVNEPKTRFGLTSKKANFSQEEGLDDLF